MLLITTLGLSGLVAAHVVVQNSASSAAGGTNAPFQFANAPNYPRANGLGVVTDAFPSATDTAVLVSLSGFSGSFGSYALDTLEVVTVARTSVAWTLHLDVSVPIAGSGINALWVSYCSRAPTQVPATGTPLASGTDINGNPWAIFAPTCPGGAIESSLDVTGAGPIVGAPVNVPAGRAAGNVVLYISFLWAVGSTGVTTTTPGVVTLVCQA